MADLAQPAPEREMARRLFTGGEMMVIPALRRDEQASGFPVHPNHFLFPTGIPHEGIPFAADDNHLGAGTVPMRFFIGSGFDRHDMADHGIPGKVDPQSAETDAPFRMGIEGHRVQIRNISTILTAICWRSLPGPTVAAVPLPPDLIP